jgi:hypothetical protein
MYQEYQQEKLLSLFLLESEVLVLRFLEFDQEFFVRLFLTFEIELLD